MICYHTTTKERLRSILSGGLLPNSLPTWFYSRTPYVMLSPEPWPDLNGARSVVLEVNEPLIREEYFDDPEGLRWPYIIPPERIRIYKEGRSRRWGNSRGKVSRGMIFHRRNVLARSPEPKITYAPPGHRNVRLITRDTAKSIYRIAMIR